MPGDHLACHDMEDYVRGAVTDRREEGTMEQTVYGMSVTTSLSLEDAEEQIRRSAADRNA